MVGQRHKVFLSCYVPLKARVQQSMLLKYLPCLTIVRFPGLLNLFDKAMEQNEKF